MIFIRRYVIRNDSILMDQKEYRVMTKQLGFIKS